MHVRLTRKLAEMVDGIDLSGRRVGDVLSLTPHEAELLIAEGWAERIGGDGVQPADVAPRRTEPPPEPKRSLPESPHEALAPPHTAERLRAIRHDIEMRSFGERARRRAEDRIREELQDSRARTLGREPDEPTDDRF
jgi:hypothetical protein